MNTMGCNHECAASCYCSSAAHLRCVRCGYDWVPFYSPAFFTELV